MSINITSENLAQQPLCIKVYEICDKIPFISTTTNLYILFQKYFELPKEIKTNKNFSKIIK